VKVAFLGSDRWSVPALEALADSPHEVTLVATREPKPAGRGSRLTPTAVGEAGRALGLPVAEVATVKRDEGLEALRESRPDVLAVVAYGEILPREVLDLPSVAPVNLHFSLLPELRGAAPVQHALLRGLAVTGVSTIRMDEGMDTGPILLQAEEPVDEADDAGSLGARLAVVGAVTLVETVSRLEAGTLEERPQDDARASIAPKLGPADRILDWTEPAEAVVRRVRALAPEPGAATTFRGRRLKVLRARVLPGDAAAPGSVALVTKDGLAVGTAEGLVALEEVAPEGRSRMSGGEFARGFRPEPGEVLDH
jgi:methionyl-tRNA formyltransferase